ncbi:MAG: hypothetical protein HQL02_00425 [Nitrospirae bacterium]|nr:hypothetical protein [Nitrospirota bacterium]
MRELKQIKGDIFSIDEYANKYDLLKNKPLDIAFSSLQTALEAYFSTYNKTVYHGSIEEDTSIPQDVRDFHLWFGYYKAYLETIVYFQNFFELSIKKLLKDNGIKYQHIKFPPAIDELCKLISGGKVNLNIVNTDLTNALTTLGTYRNNLWHDLDKEGLRYIALDEFIGGYILPIICEFDSLYVASGYSWKHKETYCEIDPIGEIIKTVKTCNGKLDTDSVLKIAILKEIGRASYKNPLVFSEKINTESFNAPHIDKALNIASLEKEGKGNNVYKVCFCPVCGVESLVIYYDDEDDSVSFTDEAKCMCCTFNINRSLKNPSKHGLKGKCIEDYWKDI